MLQGIHEMKYQEDFPGEYWDAWVRELAPQRSRVRHAGGPLMDVTVTVNGQQVHVDVEPQELLLDFLRDRLRLTGAKRSCDVEVCGACTVLVDGGPVSACTFLAVDADGREVLTVEGFAQTARVRTLRAGVRAPRRVAMRVLHTGAAADAQEPA